MLRPKTEVVALDLDSSVACTRGRWHMIDRAKDNGPDFWLRYSMECINDTAGPAMPLAQFLSRNEIPFIIVSGRSEGAREVTMEWLHKHGVFPWAVFLCDDRHNTMSHHEWKALRLKEIAEENNWTIAFMVDDITQVAVESEKLGIPTILVHDIAANFADHLG